MWQAVKLKYAADSHTTPLHPTTLIKADPLLVHKVRRRPHIVRGDSDGFHC